MKTRIHIAASLIVLSLAMAGAAFAQSSDQLGKVEFPNSCSPAAQEKLLRGIKMLHSFYYSATQRAFEEVAAEDNSCEIAAWGCPLDPDGEPASGSRRLAQGCAARADRDRDGTQDGGEDRARARLPRGGGGLLRGLRQPSQRARQLARAKAYEALAAKYPDDDEAQIFYAVYLAATQLPSDQTYSAYLKAAGILEKQFAKHPDHRGVAHYLIHSYDAPPIAQQGVPAARRYARSRQTRRTRCTCPRTSSRASAPGPIQR